MITRAERSDAWWLKRSVQYFVILLPEQDITKTIKILEMLQPAEGTARDKYAFLPKERHRDPAETGNNDKSCNHIIISQFSFLKNGGTGNHQHCADCRWK